MTQEEKLTLAKKFMEANGCREVERRFSGEMSGKYIITLRQIVHFADTVNHTPDAGKMVPADLDTIRREAFEAARDVSDQYTLERGNYVLPPVYPTAQDYIDSLKKEESK